MTQGREADNEGTWVINRNQRSAEAGCRNKQSRKNTETTNHKRKKKNKKNQAERVYERRLNTCEDNKERGYG